MHTATSAYKRGEGRIRETSMSMVGSVSCTNKDKKAVNAISYS